MNISLRHRKMDSTFTPPLNVTDETNHQQRRSNDTARNYVFERPPSGPGRLNNNQQLTHSRSLSKQGTDVDHSTALLEHLSTDLANLLNRTDISDCFLDVQGTFMAVHKCILAARSNAFAGKKKRFLNK